MHGAQSSTSDTLRAIWIGTVCTVVFAGYSLWAYFVADTPSFSFHHSLLYLHGEPKKSSFWVLVFALILAVIGTLLASLL